MNNAVATEAARLEACLASWRAIQAKPSFKLTKSQARMVARTIAELERRLAGS